MEYWKLGRILKAQSFLIKLYFFYPATTNYSLLGRCIFSWFVLWYHWHKCVSVHRCIYLWHLCVSILMTLVCICTNDSVVYLLSEFWVGGPPVGRDQQESAHPPGRLPHPVGALCQAGQQDVCGGVSTSGKKPHIDHNTIYPAITGTINVFGSTLIFTLYNNSVE